MVLLLNIIVKIINGRKNSNNNTNVVIFFVSLAESGNRKAYEFIAGNVDGMNFLQSQRHVFRRRSHIFINSSRYHLAQTIISYLS